MKPEAAERRHVILGIPEDVFPLILHRLPLKSLARFKSVSKSWHQLIQSLHPYFLGLFYAIFGQEFRPGPRPYENPSSSSSSGEGFFRYIGDDGGGGTVIDPALSFLPISDPLVIDCCNGLLILYHSDDDRGYYICNPITNSYTKLHGLNWEFSCLDFDPRVSPYFKVVSFDTPWKSVLRIRILSSETPTMAWKRYHPVKYPDPADEECYMMTRHQHHALWEGSLYLLFGIEAESFGDAGRIMRFDLFEDHVADPKLIDLPKGTKKPSGVGVGRSRNKLCLAGLDWIHNNNNNNYNNSPHHQMVLRVRVWSISKRDQTVWVLEHDSIITSSYLLCPASIDDLEEDTAYIGHFHPFLDAVFILSENMVYAYDLNNLSLNEVCHIGVDDWEVCEASIFPFLPSLVDYSTKWKPTHRRKFSHDKGMKRLTSAKRRHL